MNRAVPSTIRTPRPAKRSPRLVRRHAIGDDVAHMGASPRRNRRRSAPLLRPKCAALRMMIGALGRHGERLRRHAPLCGFSPPRCLSGAFSISTTDAEGCGRGGGRKAARAGADDADVRSDLLPCSTAIVPFRPAAGSETERAKICHSDSPVRGHGNRPAEGGDKAAKMLKNRRQTARKSH